ncbi:Ribosomal RNA adenine dimethylase [Neorhodopirellula pilleata]|uniref:Ribosomal RNA small subunit methyltransferase A n=2 Tax=Neorhodopirellula pilleata TaxID=2714738 RepID=A0A5C6A009_9BACT|nr:Ribosomal RNA adenine dimethylase [Neorhodopirellula pilleata]
MTQSPNTNDQANMSDKTDEQTSGEQLAGEETIVKFDRDRSKHRRPAEAPAPVIEDKKIQPYELSPYGRSPQIPSPDQKAQDKQRSRRASRQTATFLSKRLTAAGLKPVSKYGQNFLIDLNLVELIARSAELQPNDLVLEIGTGVGSLTSIMAEQAGAILTVEIDQNLFNLAAEELVAFPHVKMIHGDALRNKNTLRQDIMENIRDAKARLPEGGRFMLVANLPYNVATPIISNLLHESPPPDRMVVTIQKELGERIVAQPGTKDYGALSVWVQSMCAAEIVRILPPTVFWPRPKVESAVIRLDLDHEKRNAIADLKYFHSTVRSLFFHRRKFLRSVVISAMKGRLEKTQVDEILQSLGHGETARAEELDLNQIMALAEALRLAEA